MKQAARSYDRAPGFFWKTFRMTVLGCNLTEQLALTDPGFQILTGKLVRLILAFREMSHW